MICMGGNAAHDAWVRENMQRISIKIRKDDPLLLDMARAIELGWAENQTAMIKEALREWLDDRIGKSATDELNDI